MDRELMTAIANDAFPTFSDAEMAQRHRAVRTEMEKRNLDALLFYGCIAMGNSQGQVNLQYVARYAAVIETYLLFPANGEPTMFLAVPYHIPNARAISYVQDIRSGNALQNATARIKELKLDRARIGIVGPGATSRAGLTLFVEQQKYLDDNLPRARFENATSWVDDLRLIKSDEELALLKRAGAITDLVHEEVFQLTRPGVSHLELRRAHDALAARHGATFPFGHISSISMTNPSGHYPDFYPTETRVASAELVMTEFVLGYGNYWAKLWGSYFVGEPTPDYRRLFEAAAKVHDNLVAGLKPGMTGRDVNEFLQPITDAGLEQPANVLVGGWSAMNHAPAMGAMPISLSAPLANQYLDAVLQPRQTVTLHAWVRVPGSPKGLWVGSSGAITESGFESFNRYPISTLRVAG
jgi:Xaa-Pro aminopeptidase